MSSILNGTAIVAYLARVEEQGGWHSDSGKRQEPCRAFVTQQCDTCRARCLQHASSGEHGISFDLQDQGLGFQHYSRGNDLSGTAHVQMRKIWCSKLELKILNPGVISGLQKK